MQSDDLTIRVLVEIRDGLHEVRDEVRQTNLRVDKLTERVDHLTDRVGNVETGLETLGRRVVESELRTATAITELQGTMRDIHGLLKNHSIFATASSAASTRSTS